MKQSEIILTTIFCLFICLVFFTQHFLMNSHSDYNFELGNISEDDIKAPFSYTVYKTKEMLKDEQAEALKKAKPIYYISENETFNILKKLNLLFEQFANTYSFKDSIDYQLLSEEYYYNNNFIFSLEFFKYFESNKNRNDAYTKLSTHLPTILATGIFFNTIDDTIRLANDDSYELITRKQLYSKEKAYKFTLKHFNKKAKPFVEEILSFLLIQNIKIDKNRTDQEKIKILESIDPIYMTVLKNDVIIEKNQKITEKDKLKIDALSDSYREQGFKKKKSEIILNLSGVFLFTLFLIIIIYIILKKNEILGYRIKYYFIVLILLTFIALITFVIGDIFHRTPLFIPVSLSILCMIILFGEHIGIIFGIFQLIFLSLFLKENIHLSGLLTLSTIAVVLTLRKNQNQYDFLPLFLLHSFYFLILFTALSMSKSASFLVYFEHLFYGILSCFISVSTALLITPWIQKKINMASRQNLLELLDYNNPLLKKMASTTPGTYHHSLNVGNIAETIAEVIGANTLIARVGGYYHDIGKMENPSIFIENNKEAPKIHENFTSQESASKIRQHVANGIALARKNGLPKTIIDIIQQHHGVSFIRYFYLKAKLHDEDIDESLFRYFGPNPQSKEAVIVMIADIVESTTKSITEITKEKIENVIEATIQNLIYEKVLDEAPITLNELYKIKTNLLPILVGIYHQRLEYPQVNHEVASQKIKDK